MPQVEITAMTFGPFGIGRADGRAVMVPHAAPGDVLEVAIVAERRGYAIAEIQRIVARGDARRDPPCPYLPRCGGCDWQQIAYRDQTRLKGEVIAHELGRALGIKLDPAALVEPAPAEFGYRSRVRLKVGRGGALGFHGAGTNQLVEVEACMLAEPGLRMPSALASALARDLAEIEAVAAGGGRAVLVGHLRRAAAPHQIDRARRVMESDEAIAGVVLRWAGGRETLGAIEVESEIEPGLAIRIDADLFSQVNRAQNLKLVARAMEMARPAAGIALLDLFCGAGNLSLPAARRGARVTAVDSDPLAVAAAARNAARLGFGDAQFVAMKAHEMAAFLSRAGARPDAVILDPPRTGAAALMEPVARLKPARVIYVSCDVPTLARDLRALCAHGYSVERIDAFDFFPNTHHAEILTCLVLT
jgi:23S rRNA (uracil1939-C5)-methyltransferase